MPKNWQLVQKVIGHNSAQAFTSNVTQGNLLVVFIVNLSANVTGISDTLGTTWINAVNVNSGVPRCYIFYGVARSSGANTVTYTGAAGNRVMALIEYSGRFLTAPLDAVNRYVDVPLSPQGPVGKTSSTTSTAPSAGVIPVTRDNTLVVCLWGSGSSPSTSTAGTGFTQQLSIFNAGGTQSSGAVEDGIFNTDALAAFTVGSSIAWGCVAVAFQEAPPAQNRWAFKAVQKFGGVVPPPAASGSWSDTLTWTTTDTLVSVDAFTSDTVTWTPTHTATDVDDPIGDTLTWSDTFSLVSVDAFTSDTLTWTTTETATGIDANTADTLTWSDTFDLISTDASLADTLTWTLTNTLVSVDVEVDDTLTWTTLDEAVADGDVRDTLTWDGSFQGLPEVEGFITDLLLWSQNFGSDILLADTVTWLDAFVFDGEVFPDLSASWHDTLTWDMQPDEAQTWQDAVTWSDQFTLPIQSVRQAEILTWADSFAPDVNLLAFARYRR